MVAEDIGLLPRDIVTDLLYETSEKGASSYDLFGALFRQMASEEPARGGRFETVQYFNGGLFEVVEPIDLKRAEAVHVSIVNWTKLNRYVIDFEQRDRFEAEQYREAFDWVTKHALPDRTRKAEEGKDAAGKLHPHHRASRARWWQLSFGRPEMLSIIKPLKLSRVRLCKSGRSSCSFRHKFDRAT